MKRAEKIMKQIEYPNLDMDCEECEYNGRCLENYDCRKAIALAIDRELPKEKALLIDFLNWWGEETAGEPTRTETDNEDIAMEYLEDKEEL